MKACRASVWSCSCAGAGSESSGGLWGGRLFASPGRQSLLAGGCQSCGRNGGTDLSDPNQDGAGENQQAGIRGVKALQTKALTPYAYAKRAESIPPELSLAIVKVFCIRVEPTSKQVGRNTPTNGRCACKPMLMV